MSTWCDTGKHKKIHVTNIGALAENRTRYHQHKIYQSTLFNTTCRGKHSYLVFGSFQPESLLGLWL